jgi:hypothetical protein
VEPAGVDGPRRPRRRWLLAGLLLGVAALLAAAWTVAPGQLTRLGPVSLGFGDDAPATVVEGFEGPAGAYVVGYEHDTYVEMTVAVPNRAPVGLEVVDVRPVLQDAPLLVPTEGWAPAAERSAAGETATGAWRLRFDNCEAYHEREAMVIDRVEVVSRVLGRLVVEEVALDRPMMVRSPMLWQCPDRTLDRQDDRRGGGPSFRRDAP